MRIIEVTEEQAQVLALLVKLQESDGDIIIAQSGKPTAKLMRYNEPSPSGNKRSGIFDGELYIAEDFDELTEEEEKAFGMID